ncbi:pre-mRNA-splicing ATP-dependent RNA helicase prp28 [Senna tora]|uniref:Pre-mRNA-splicing ATP-dependent RNA helicase prp28 n=1 Tax=Senna tora TaxID=362788 RepID=A0A834W6A7_9FABA|nr:pre-mRNA-splicing ATP-dependent RNA helicase prp28 [Senna tora]
MEREERKRKFNEAIVNMLYPPPPSQPEQESKPVQAASDAIPDTLLEDSGSASSSGDEEQESEPDQKLTRAQRKKIRKKKLKEEAVRRGELIGPLLPLNRTNTDQCADPDAKRSPPVRPNASEENSGADEPADGLPAKKINQRRKAKKMAKVKPKSSSNSDGGNQHSISNASDDLKEAN